MRVTPANQKGIGFRPNSYVNAVRFICRVLTRALRLDGRNFFSNEFIQALNPTAEVMWGGETLMFRTGHGRLKWRVDTFETEEPLMLEWLSGLTEQDVFLDIGANVGTYTVPAGKKAGSVIAVELDPSNVGILYENLFLNALTEKVTIIPVGLGERSSVQMVYYRDFSKGDALQSVGRPSPFTMHAMSNPHRCSQIIMGLDELFSVFSLPRPNKIKIDVDGNERAVFDGGRDVILSATEIYFEDSDQPDSKYVLDALHAAGFAVAKRELNRNPNFGEVYNLLLARAVGQAVKRSPHP